jgi:hypothetical protein
LLPPVYTERGNRWSPSLVVRNTHGLNVTRTQVRQRVQAALVELSGDFGAHVDITEGPRGLYQDLLKTSPRLSEAVAGVTASMS